MSSGIVTVRSRAANAFVASVLSNDPASDPRPGSARTSRGSRSTIAPDRGLGARHSADARVSSTCCEAS